MASEFRILREAWLALDEPSQEVRESARARLFEEIAFEESERLGHSREQEQERSGLSGAVRGARRRSGEHRTARPPRVLLFVGVLVLAFVLIVAAAYALGHPVISFQAHRGRPRAPSRLLLALGRRAARHGSR